MWNYQIAQETDARNGVTAEGCVKGLLQCSTPSQTGCWITFVTGVVSPVSLCYSGRTFLMIGSSDDDPFDKRRHLWRPILPNRQFEKVCSFEQTAADDPAQISENLMDGRNVLLHKNA
jgi:hypothetical protein